MSEEIQRFMTRDKINGYRKVHFGKCGSCGDIFRLSGPQLGMAVLRCGICAQRRFPAWPMTETESVDEKRDPTQPPSYYKAKHRANGIEPGSELADAMAAFRGKQFAIDFLIGELITKAWRLGQGRDRMDDLFKIEQTTAKLRQLWEVE